MSEYKNSIQIGIKIDPQNKAEVELKELIKKLNKNEINLNIGNQAQEKLSSLSKLLDVLYNKSNKSISLDSLTNSAEESAKVFTELSDQMGKLHEKSNLKLNTKNGLQEAKDVNNALEEQYKLEQQMASIRSKADNNKKQREIQEQNELNKTLQTEQNLVNQIANNREKSELKSKQVDKSQELEQAKAINQVLEDNYKASLKEADAQKQVQQEIQKQVKLLEIQKQALNRQYGNKIDTSSIDNAISKLKSMDNINMKDLRNEISNIGVGIKDITEKARSSESILGKLGSSLRNVGIYFDVGDIFRGLINTAKEAVGYVVKIEDSMVSLKRVVDGISTSGFENLQNEIHNMAVSTASSTSDMVETVTDWKKLGYDLQQAKGLAEQSTKFNLAGDVNNIKETTTDLIAIIRGFGIANADAVVKTKEISDAINQLSNNYAVSSKDLADSMQRSSSALKLAGNSINESLSLATVSNEVNQNSEKVGVGLKTISMRLRGVSQDGEELDAKLGELVKNSTGVDMTMNGAFRSTFDILKDIAKVWNSGTLDDMTKANLAEKLFGKNQATVGLAILENFKQLESTMKSLEGSAGSVEKEFARSMDSTSPKVKQLKENVGGIFTQFVNSDMTKGVVSGLNSFVVASSSVIKTLGAIPTVLATVIGSLTIFSSKFRESMSSYQPSALTNYTNNLKGLSSLYRDDVKTIQDKIIVQKAEIATQNMTGTSYVSSRAKLLGLQGQLVVTTVAEKACAIGAQALGVAFNMALGLGIGLVIQGLSELANASENAKQKNEALLTSITSMKTDVSSLEELKSKYSSLSKELDSGNLSTEESTKKKQELKDIYDQLIQTAPELEGLFKIENENYEKNIDLIKQVIKLKNDQLRLDTDKYITDNDVNDKGIDKKLEKLKQYQKEVDGFGKKSLMTDDELHSSGDLMFGNGDSRRKYFEQLKNDSKQAVLDLQSELQQDLAKSKSIETLGGKNPISNQKSEDVAKAIGELEIYSDKAKDVTKETKQSANSITSMKNAMKELNGEAGKISDATLKSLKETFPDLSIDANDTSGAIKKFNKELTDNASVVSSAKKELVGLKEGSNLSEATISKLAKAFPELKINSSNAKEMLSKLPSVEKAIGDEADSTSTKLQKLADKFSNLGDEAKMIDTIKDEMSKYGGISEDTYSTIISKFPDLLALMSQEGDLTTNLTKKQTELRAEQEKTKQEAIAKATETTNAQAKADSDSTTSNADANATKTANDTNYSETAKTNATDTSSTQQQSDADSANNHADTTGVKSQNDADYNNEVRTNASDTTTEESQAYEDDKANQSNANEEKKSNSTTLRDVAVSLAWGITTGNWSAYDADKNNFIDSIKEKIKWLMFWKDSSVDDTPKKTMNSNGTPKGLAVDVDTIKKVKEASKKAEEDAKRKASEESRKKALANMPKTISAKQASDIDSEAKGAKSAEKKAEAEAKKALAKITGAYDDASKKIESSISEISYQKELLGEPTDDNFSPRLELQNKQLDLQKDKVNEAMQQLMQLENTSYDTEEATKALADATEKATKELNSQRLEVAKLSSEIQKLEVEQIKKVVEQEKEVAELELDGKQKVQTKALEEYTQTFEDTHETTMQGIEDETKALEKKHDEEQKSIDLQEKKNSLKKAEIDLERQKNNKTIKTFELQSDGSYQSSYRADKKEIEKAQEKVDEENKAIKKIESDKKFEDAKAEIETRKKAEEDLYKEQKKNLEKYSKDLKEAQDLEKERLDYHYKDLDKLSKNRLAELNQQYGDNWQEINKTIDKNLTDIKTKFDRLSEIKVNFGLEGVDEATKSKDLNKYIIDRKSQLDKVVELDLGSLKLQVENLKVKHGEIDKENDTHHETILTKQNTAQENQYNSTQDFAKGYLLLYDKFLETVQIDTDFRFSNIVNIIQGANKLILDSLVNAENDYEKYAEIYNKMNPKDKIASSVDISSNIANLDNYKKSVLDWTNSKLELYKPEQFDKYMGEVGNQMGNAIIGRLNGMTYSANGTSTSSNNISNINNKNNSSITHVNYNFDNVSLPNVRGEAKSVLKEFVQGVGELGYLKK